MSKALKETQQGYAAIEIESLAVVWALEKFHHFLYASHFILETDPKTIGSHLIQKPKPSNTKATMKFDQNISL